MKNTAQPAAPEPSDSLDRFFGALPDLPNPSLYEETLDEARAWQARATEAEAQLAAVREEVRPPEPNCGKHHGARFRDCYSCAQLPAAPNPWDVVLNPQPAAPEPSCPELGDLVDASWMARCVAAEAQLAAVREEVRRWRGVDYCNGGDSYIARIERALSTAPSPGEGRGT